MPSLGGGLEITGPVIHNALPLCFLSAGEGLLHVRSMFQRESSRHDYFLGKLDVKYKMPVNSRENPPQSFSLAASHNSLSSSWSIMLSHTLVNGLLPHCHFLQGVHVVG